MQKKLKKFSVSTLALSVFLSINAFAANQVSTVVPVEPPPGNTLEQINYGVYQIDNDVRQGFELVIKEIALASDYISQMIHGFITTSGHLMFTVSPDLQTTMETSYGQGVSSPVAVGMAYRKTNEELNQIVSADSETPDVLARQLRLASLVPVSLKNVGNSEVASNSDENDALFAPMNLDSLLAPDAYSVKNEEENARAFIKYASYETDPFFNLSAAYFTQNYLPVEQYRAYYGTYAAMQSIGLSNFNELFYQRLPQKGLGTLAGLDPSHPDASVQQVEHHMIVERGLNPQWYAEMETAPPATIQRESLYTLAAVQVELYNNNQLLQRLLTTVSAMQLTQNQTEVRHNLSAMQQNIVFQAKMKNPQGSNFSQLSRQYQINSSSSTPATPTTGGSVSPSTAP